MCIVLCQSGKNYEHYGGTCGLLFHITSTLKTKAGISSEYLVINCCHWFIGHLHENSTVTNVHGAIFPEGLSDFLDMCLTGETRVGNHGGNKKS
jgi:hypothetical protein